MSLWGRRNQRFAVSTTNHAPLTNRPMSLPQAQTMRGIIITIMREGRTDRVMGME